MIIGATIFLVGAIVGFFAARNNGDGTTLDKVADKIDEKWDEKVKPIIDKLEEKVNKM